MNPTTMSNKVPTIAVITNNSLMGVGLQSMLSEIIPVAIIELCDIDSLVSSGAEEHFHIFASVNIVLENMSLFEARRAKTILLTNGSVHASLLRGFVQIDVSGSAESVRKQLVALHSSAHRGGGGEQGHSDTEVLTPREIEVLKLLVDGKLNKEIAHELRIGLTTVISHRKNIVEKLGIRSLSGLTIYAVMKGYLEI